VIVPTTCRRTRADRLWRALASIRSQTVDLEIIVVVNGREYDAELYGDLRSEPDLRVLYVEEGGLPHALRQGRAAVNQPFFSFLDDDDEYLPGALRTRLDVMARDATLDLVVTNWIMDSGEPHIRSTAGIESDPMGALLRANWLASCGGLFRSARVTEDFFDPTIRFYEWTMVAVQILIRGGRIRFLDVPTYRVNQSDDSLSRTDAYYGAEPAFLERLLALDLAEEHRRVLRQKHRASLHDVADRELRAGNLGAAWRYHLRSLAAAGGVRHLKYTLRLIARTVAGQWTARA
jgi:glycosyltransferase involved in cell wall biosynthesis